MTTMLTKQQLAALETLPFYELKTLREALVSAVESYDMGGYTTCRKLIEVAQQLIGPFPPESVVVVRNQVGIVWVIRTPP